MIEFDMPTQIVNLVKITLRKTMNKVHIIGTLSDSFETISVLRQGDSFSALLFNLTFEKITRNRTVNPSGSKFYRTRQYMTNADDDDDDVPWLRNVSRNSRHHTCSP
jgi:hypothetical protein